MDFRRLLVGDPTFCMPSLLFFEVSLVMPGLTDI
jgi:hypothetical protein